MKKQKQKIQSSRFLQLIWHNVLILLLIISLNGCYFDVIVPGDTNETVEVSFSNDIIPVFQSGCISCHDGQITVPNLTRESAYLELTTGDYLSVASPSTSGLITKIESGHPFAGALSEPEVRKIIKWMEEGAANN